MQETLKTLLIVSKTLNFLIERFEERPNITNARRLNMFTDLLCGMKTSTFCAKYGLTRRKSENQVWKILNRLIQYAGNKEFVDVKTIRNFGSMLYLSKLSKLYFNGNDKLKFLASENSCEDIKKLFKIT